jgi:regulator of replication initiation timing
MTDWDEKFDMARKELHEQIDLACQVYKTVVEERKALKRQNADLREEIRQHMLHVQILERDLAQERIEKSAAPHKNITPGTADSCYFKR